jgi:ribosomal protein L31
MIVKLMLLGIENAEKQRAGFGSKRFAVKMLHPDLSTRENIRVEICSKCHPFYTGQRKYVDSEGRVQKFAKKYGIQV